MKCQHAANILDEVAGAWECSVCGSFTGWHCPTAPAKQCRYTDWDEESHEPHATCLICGKDRVRDEIESDKAPRGQYNHPVKIAFDIGGVLSKFPDILRPIFKLLQTSPDIEVHVITDMHDPKQSMDMLRRNGFEVPPNRLHNSDFKRYGEGCKAELLESLDFDILIDDFPAYVAAGCPLRLLVMPDIQRTYYHPTWETDGSEGDFGRRIRHRASSE
jgi:hypothetical protein